jgi:hypothetical protein
MPMNRDQWLAAAKAHRAAADTLLRIFEPDAALIEMDRALAADAEVARLSEGN